MQNDLQKPFVQLIECPRDAMQGWHQFIPTEQKIKYINSLLKVGFHTIDFGSFVSPKAIPQMRDTKEVLEGLQFGETQSKLLSIVANLRGANEAVVYDEISYIGFPLSLSPTFQRRNTNSTIEESLQTVDALQNVCIKANKKLVVYLSMGFGNPYGDDYNEDVLLSFAEILWGKEISILSLSDTVGLADAAAVQSAFSTLVPAYPHITFGAHLHTSQHNFRQKLIAAVTGGCRRFDGALKGFGGCPMASDHLLGNMPTESMIAGLEEQGFTTFINKEKLSESLALAAELFT